MKRKYVKTMMANHRENVRKLAQLPGILTSDYKEIPAGTEVTLFLAENGDLYIMNSIGKRLQFEWTMAVQDVKLKKSGLEIRTQWRDIRVKPNDFLNAILFTRKMRIRCIEKRQLA